MPRETKKWTDIHPDFTPELQKEWEEEWGLNYFDVKEIIKKDLIKAYNPKYDAHFAYIDIVGKKIKHNNYLKIKLNNQEWFNENFPLEKRKEIKLLDISRKNLTGKIIIDNFPELKRIICVFNEIENLSFVNCPKLAEIYCAHAHIINWMNLL
ncbi:MAG: hypothetical protein LBR43_00345 [Spiroplasmataceae bacterium]|jgi:hypothetical protein|nr:hypothetical protein [Spiroplasmataceae bacterium]